MPHEAVVVRPNLTSVYVIHPVLKYRVPGEYLRSPQSSLDEACGLAEAIELDIKGREIINLSKISPSTYLGMGVVEKLKQEIGNKKIKLLYVDTALTPGQQRNLETECKCKVIDRTGMILEIFGERAKTHEGTLQVELAALTYQRSRLVRSWTHLERQRGGHGFLGGPGEKQLELDRRMLEQRISKIKEELAGVVRTRRLQRKERQKNHIPVVALVGYTNAGKSTLFNKITSAGVLAKDMLFATLDPTLRQSKMPAGRQVLFSDTVGFISNLPTQLVAAFRATLEEVEEADIILHVRDIADTETEAQKLDVEKVLSELELDQAALSTRMIEVWNKIDLLDPDHSRELLHHAQDGRKVVPISALTGEGLDKLFSVMEDVFSNMNERLSIAIPQEEGKAIAWLYDNATVLNRTDREEMCVLSLSLDKSVKERFHKKFPNISFLEQ